MKTNRTRRGGGRRGGGWTRGRWSVWLAAATAAACGAAVAGCGGGAEEVRLRLLTVGVGASAESGGVAGVGVASLEGSDGARWRGLAGAKVTVVSLRSGDVPLPIGSETLEEVLSAPERRVGVTNERGEVSLEVLPGRPMMVYASPGPFDERFSGRELWAWRVGPSGVSAERVETRGTDGGDEADEEADVSLELVRGSAER